MNVHEFHSGSHDYCTSGIDIMHGLQGVLALLATHDVHEFHSGNHDYCTSGAV